MLWLTLTSFSAQCCCLKCPILVSTTGLSPDLCWGGALGNSGKVCPLHVGSIQAAEGAWLQLSSWTKSSGSVHIMFCKLVPTITTRNSHPNCQEKRLEVVIWRSADFALCSSFRKWNPEKGALGWKSLEPWNRKRMLALFLNTVSELAIFMWEKKIAGTTEFLLLQS